MWKCEKCGTENNSKFCRECGAQRPVGEFTDFTCIKLTTGNSTAQKTVYKAQKTENGVHIEYYLIPSYAAGMMGMMSALGGMGMMSMMNGMTPSANPNTTYPSGAPAIPDEPANQKTMLKNYEASADVYKDLARCLSACNIISWNGFSGPSPAGMRDGGDFTLHVVLDDGTEISASGTNNYPQNYSTLLSALQQLCID